MAAQLFVVRSGILSSIQDRSFFHGFTHFRKIPLVFRQSGKVHTVHGIQFQEHIHGRRGHHIDVFQRLLQHGPVLRNGIRHRAFFRYHKIRPSVRDPDHIIPAFIPVHGKLPCPLQRKFSGLFQFRKPFLGISRAAGAAAGKQQEKYQNDRKPVFYFFLFNSHISNAHRITTTPITIQTVLCPDPSSGISNLRVYSTS